MRDWQSVKQEYLQTLLSREGPIGNRCCSICSARDGSWRCLDCLATPLFCIHCCRSTHHRLPFHRVERWTGSYFTPSWLQQVGVTIHLGHDGNSCPTSIPNLADSDAWGGSDAGSDAPGPSTVDQNLGINANEGENLHTILHLYQSTIAH
jgi:hypothetical protein